MSTGFAYRILDKENIVITGRGTCQDKYIFIPGSIDGYKVVAINSHAFMNDDLLETLTLSDPLLDVGTAAFRKCTNLKKIIINSNLTFLHRGAFALCSKLDTIVFASIKQVEFFHKECFLECNNIKNITINN